MINSIMDEMRQWIDNKQSLLREWAPFLQGGGALSHD